MRYGSGPARLEGPSVARRLFGCSGVAAACAVASVAAASVVVVSAQPDQQQFPGMPVPLYAASPSKLLAFLDCPRRYRLQYLDRPVPEKRRQRAHTSLGNAVHNALRDWWDLPERTPERGAGLVDRAWIEVGFRDGEQSREWREKMRAAVTAYLAGVDPAGQPVGIERTVSFVSGDLRVSGRVDRLDDRDGELVVVDYKTSRVPSTDDDARTSLALGLYAAAVWKMFRRRTLRVELHHVPSGTVAAHEHTPESLTRKVEQARSIARDARRAPGRCAAGATCVRTARRGRRPGPRSPTGRRSRSVHRSETSGGPPGVESWGDMEQRVSFVTLAVRDVDRSRSFYVDGLGWSPELDVPGEVLMFSAGERLVLSLWVRAAFEEEVGGPTLEGDGVVPMTLSHNVARPAEVRDVLARATAAGATVTGPVEREWGGYTGYFADPDGFRWEVAWNPGPIGLRVVPDTDVDARV